MKHLFVPYELAVKLKEKGFDEPCLAEWNDDGNKLFGHISNISSPFKNSFINKITDKSATAAPIFQQVTDWFFEEHQILISPVMSSSNDLYWEVEDNQNVYTSDTKEEAVQIALKLI